MRDYTYRLLLFIGVFLLCCAVECHAQQQDPDKPIPASLKTYISNFKINGIVWFEEPSKRFVIIDDQIFREGDAKGEFKILRIFPYQVQFTYQDRAYVINLKEEGDPPPLRAVYKSQEIEGEESQAQKVGQDEESAPEAIRGKEIDVQVYVSVPPLSNIREAPDINASVKHRIRGGTKLFSVSIEGDWLKLRLRDNSFGYIHGSVVKRVE